jgi:2-polyprenyl-3-methyl-5-hydroxy-6-metoxy-1,4-benzoquinol methylase
MPNTIAFRVNRYFEKTASRFDAIYEDAKSPLQRLVDAAFRGVIHKRFRLILEDLKDVEGKRVLDAGCGSGRYCVALAERGASVVGVDFSQPMLEIADTLAARAGVKDRCLFLHGELLSLQLEQPFDAVLGVGFFDYLQNPGEVLERLLALTRERAYFSFPKRWTFRTLVRKARLGLRGCYVRFYTRKEIEDLFNEHGGGLNKVRILSLDRDYLVYYKA